MADAALDAIDGFIEEQGTDRDAAGWRTKLAAPPDVEFNADSSYFWELRTNIGSITVRLLQDAAPKHVASTIYLTRLGFYDGLVFHRVITEFMAQGGCPLGTGTGGPGYQYDGEFEGSARHDRGGMLSMANAGPGTDGSQFFLTFVPTPHLDDKHAIFGAVTGGMDVVETLESKGSGSGKTSEHLEMVSTKIRAVCA